MFPIALFKLRDRAVDIEYFCRPSSTAVREW